MSHHPTPHSRSAHAFTIVELLVVISIISLLLSLLLPTLVGARDLARDLKCAASMRGTIQAIGNYKVAYPKTGLQSLSEQCTYWNTGFSGGGPGAHFQDATYGGQGHGWDEGRAFWPFWRERLAKAGLVGILSYDPITGKPTGLVNSSGLGCNAKDYSSLKFLNSSNTTASNYASVAFVDFETTPSAKSYASNPAYFWLGPGSYDTTQTTSYAANVSVPVSKWSSVDSKTMSYDNFGPLFQCPQVQTFYNGVYKLYEVTHRPQWGQFSSLNVNPCGMPYASNVGMTDGSVKFYMNQHGGFIYPVQ